MTEQAIHISGAGVDLEGVLHLPDVPAPMPGVVICHPHPRYGGDMDNGVVLALADAVLSRGLAALRFNFRGVGRNSGVFDNGVGEAKDVAAAVAYLAGRDEIDSGEILLAGYSFGAIMAMRAADVGTRALVMVSPPIQSIARDDSGVWAGPLLLIGGDSDPICPARAMEDFAARRGEGTLARVVAGADHSWWGHETELSAIAGDFLVANVGTGVDVV